MRKYLEKFVARDRVEQKDSKKAGNHKEAGNTYQNEGKEMEAGKRQKDDTALGDIWKFGRQKSPLVPGTPAVATGNAGTPSTCMRGAGNDNAGNLMTDQEATYIVNVWENCLNCVENQEEILH